MASQLLDLDVVSGWLDSRRERLGPRVQGARAVRVEQLSRGVSRETWAVDAVVRGPDGERELPLAVRRDHPAGSVIPSDLRTEYEVYARLADTAVPVARALWFEDDAAVAPDGRPGYVRERVRGSWHLPFLSDDDPARDDRRIEASRVHLEALAAVHLVDWRTCGFDRLFPVPSSPAAAAVELLERVRRQAEELLGEASPVLAEACSALAARAPRDAPAVVLCKGTNGHGEEVWRDGRIVAMSDWELACLGDPAYDLAQVQEMVPTIVRDGRRVWGWPEALEHYTSRSGLVVTEERLRWYRDLYAVLQLAYCAHSGAAVRRLGATAPLRFVWTAYEVAYHAERKLAAVAASARSATT
ncbi:MAG TPA: phosphotransferase family protein [Mycobacteriales bacterium]|nr:phosphotransferase family protein [Mycobacteriales bacterium]